MIGSDSGLHPIVLALTYQVARTFHFVDAHFPKPTRARASVAKSEWGSVSPTDRYHRPSSDTWAVLGVEERRRRHGAASEPLVVAKAGIYK